MSLRAKHKVKFLVLQYYANKQYLDCVNAIHILHCYGRATPSFATRMYSVFFTAHVLCDPMYINDTGYTSCADYAGSAYARPEKRIWIYFCVCVCMRVHMHVRANSLV